MPKREGEDMGLYFYDRKSVSPNIGFERRLPVAKYVSLFAQRSAMVVVCDAQTYPIHYYSTSRFQLSLARKQQPLFLVTLL